MLLLLSGKTAKQSGHNLEALDDKAELCAEGYDNRLRAYPFHQGQERPGLLGTWSKGQQISRLSRGMQVFPFRGGQGECALGTRGGLGGGVEACGVREIWKA